MRIRLATSTLKGCLFDLNDCLRFLHRRQVSRNPCSHFYRQVTHLDVPSLKATTFRAMKTRTLLVLLVFALAACAETAPEVDPRRDPNGVSELALLMREMTLDMERVRTRVLAGEQAACEAGIDRLFSATATEPEKAASEAFSAFGASYLHVVSTLENTPDSLQGPVYDQVIQACANCHQTMCPGPLVRIEQLRR